jgi:hypothetical protein
MSKQQTPDRIDRLETELAALKRERDLRERGMDELPAPSDYFETVAAEQTRRFLIRRERTQRGHEARERFAAKTASRRVKLEDTLSKRARQRAGDLEKHEAQRRNLIESYQARERKPMAELAALRDEADAAGKQAEAEPIDIETPRVQLKRDDSDLEANASKQAVQVGRLPKDTTSTWGVR